MLAFARDLLLVAVSLCLFAASNAVAAPEKSEADFVPDPASILRHGPAYRYTQAGWIVLHIEGKPYDRGYQHGRLLAPEIADYAQAMANHRSPKDPAAVWQQMRTLTNSLFLRRYDTEFLEEMKGIADGAAAAGAKFDNRPLDLIDIVTLNSEIELDFLDSGLKATPTPLDGLRFGSGPLDVTCPDEEDHCSAFAATGPATRDGQIVFGHITMFGLYHVRHFNVWIDIQPTVGHRVSMQSYPGGIMSGLDYYQNDAGLLVAETTIQQTRFEITGQTVATRIRRAVQYADSIDKAVEILNTSNNGLYTNEWLLADVKTGEIAMFELGTARSKLWRSSRDEWPGGTRGFYWGCNNVKDLDVRKETIASLADKPANLVFAPKDRDKVWLKLFGEHRGRIDADFGFKAFTTPPLAAFHSCDAKFTTTKLAKEMKSWALFGPPLGRTWEPTHAELRRTPDIQPLVSNDWTVIHAGAAPPSGNEATKDLAESKKEKKVPQPVDLVAFPEKDEKPKDKEPPLHAAAWRGTLLPKSDADIWLAAAFAEYEKIVSLEKNLKATAKDGKLDREARDRLEVARFTPRSQWLIGARRLGRDVPLAETKAEWTENDWYAIAVGKGVLLLDALRKELGSAEFEKALDAFGREHAGGEVSTGEFRKALEKAAGHSLARIFEPWLTSGSLSSESTGNFWAIDSFEAEPQRALIVYGTQADRAATREAADLLARTIATRFTNFTIPIKADKDLSDADYKSHHLLLVGRPQVNSVTARVAGTLPIKFGSASFAFRGETYAHADTAVIAAAENPQNPRYSVVVFAGLGARAMRRCVESFTDRAPQAVQVRLLPIGRKSRSLGAIEEQPAAITTVGAK